MEYEVLKNFSGIIVGTKGRVIKIKDPELANDLKKAGYIKDYVPDNKESLQQQIQELTEEKNSLEASVQELTTIVKKYQVKTKVPEGQENVLEKTVEDLQENISIDENDNITGTLKYIDNYPGFSKNAKGNFIALYFEDAKNGQNVMCEVKGTGAVVKKPKAVDQSDGMMVLNIHNNDNTIEVTCEGKEPRTLKLTDVILTQPES